MLLADIVETIRRYVFLSEEQATGAALWVIFTWCHAALTHSPMLFVTSAEPDSGKTTLLGTLGFLVRRGMSNVEISGAALFRSIRKWQPCFIVDEADDVFGGNADLRSVIYSGWTHGSGVIRCHSETQDPEMFSTFAPKAIGMKGRGLPSTTLSRSIIIEMRPRRAGDPSESIADFDHVDNETFQHLRSRISRWATDHAETVAKAVPETPSGFHNRRRANWKPLLAIAEQIGGIWKESAQKAALAIEAVHETFDRSSGVELLSTIREIFGRRRVDRITSKALVETLIEDETGPWVVYGRSQKPISEHGVARLLKPFHVKPRTIRVDDKSTAKGYLLEWFDDAFERHLAPLGDETGISTVTPSQVSTVSDLFANQTVTFKSAVTVQSPSNPLKSDTCDGVTALSDRADPEQDAFEDRRCAFCRREPNGTEQECGISGETMWLHPECQKPFSAKLDGTRVL